MTTTEQVLTLVEGFYPRSLIPPRVALGVEEILTDLSKDGGYDPSR